MEEIEPSFEAARFCLGDTVLCRWTMTGGMYEENKSFVERVQVEAGQSVKYSKITNNIEIETHFEQEYNRLYLCMDNWKCGEENSKYMGAVWVDSSQIQTTRMVLTEKSCKKEIKDFFIGIGIKVYTYKELCASFRYINNKTVLYLTDMLLSRPYVKMLNYVHVYLGCVI